MMNFLNKRFWVPVVLVLGLLLFVYMYASVYVYAVNKSKASAREEPQTEQVTTHFFDGEVSVTRRFGESKGWVECPFCVPSVKDSLTDAQIGDMLDRNVEYLIQKVSKKTKMEIHPFEELRDHECPFCSDRRMHPPGFFDGLSKMEIEEHLENEWK